MIDKYLYYFNYDILAGTSVVITLLPLILIIYRKAYIDPSFRLLLFFLISKLIIDLAMFHLAATRANNLALFNATIVIRYVLLSGMFYSKFEREAIRRFILPVSVIFSIFTLWDIWQCNENLSNLHLHRLVQYSATAESILMILLVLLYFYELIRSLKIPNLLTFPFFWVCAGLLLYYSSMVFVAPALHYAAQWDSIMKIGLLDRIPYIFDIVSVLLFSMGILVFSARHYARN
ncbi:hypothetical protein DSL64_12665 [Dyadobacter luteus]|jgi:hypothetical protein|uniref:Uncharacterized protein n=1 Tax=Dyadobacter luteus TaxID=2259619 RepID=A0A3D8YBD1_9BACT|nr:hypothetical protein [Dyadobacter luteus]REA61293.1 hypothetical protein DSL64_12665 [Dyadobacter luteus]